MTTVKDIAWLAGILEGEGSFGDHKGSPTIQLSMCDQDVVDRAARLLGVKLRAPWKRRDGHKWVWKCVACGTRAIGWMMTVYPLLGERRRDRVKGVVQRWRASTRAPRAPRGQRFMARCHPDRIRAGHGLCDPCYMRQWRASHPRSAETKAKDLARLQAWNASRKGTA